jgi:aminopeptidase YwaD
VSSGRTRRRVEGHLRFLVETVGPRPPGSPANAAATDHVREVLAAAGLPVQDLPFRTAWWEPGPGRLTVGGVGVEVQPNPYSPPCDVRARVASAVSRAEVTAASCAGRVLVLSGAAAAEPVTPIDYPFYWVEEHALLVAALCAARPVAVVAVADSPAPVFEDPRLPFPSTTVPVAVGERLVEGEEVGLVLGGLVHDGAGANVSASTVGDRSRVVLSAHLDSKVTTPGAFDNAGSVAAVLAAVEQGELLREAVEVVLFNGEDHVDPCGELAWLAATDIAGVTAAVNLDGTGVADRRTQVSALSCPPEVEDRLRALVASRPGWVVGEPWYESDHAIFAMRGIPAVAVTSEHVHDLLRDVAHTPRDTLDVVDVAVLADLAEALPALVAAASTTSRPPGGGAPHAAAWRGAR